MPYTLPKIFPQQVTVLLCFFPRLCQRILFLRILSTFNILKTMTLYWEGSTSRKKKAKLIETCTVSR